MHTATSRTRVAAAAQAIALRLWLPNLAVAGEVVEYFHPDAVGNIRAVTDASGNVIERHDYLPFGDEWCGAAVCAAPTPGQPRRFTGKERDRETGYDYFGARYYSGRVGRFTGVDPVLNTTASLVNPQRWNRYSYGLNNPFRYIDPDGCQAAEPEPWSREWIARRVLSRIQVNYVPPTIMMEGDDPRPHSDAVKKAQEIVDAVDTAVDLASSTRTSLEETPHAE